MPNITQTLQILLLRFHGQVLIPLIPASESIGISAQTARNRLCKGTFPIPTRLIESKRFIHISDLADYVDSIPSSTTTPSKPEVKRKGRPPNSERFKLQSSI